MTKSNVKKIFSIAGNATKIIGITLLCIFLVVVITITIVGTALVAYVMNYMEDAEPIDLGSGALGFTTFLYADSGDPESPYTEIGSLTTGDKRIWVDIDQIPSHVQDAFVFSEDIRFYNHNGVDFQRTIGAFANMFVQIYSGNDGGSSITQQTIKLSTGNDEVTIERKIEEIFTALSVEKNYTKDDILEDYLNRIYFSNNCYGIQAAANFYFDKDVSQLTLAEGASIAAMTKSPSANNPLGQDPAPENNKIRREYILETMHEGGAISTTEYEEALAEELVFIGYNKILDENEQASSASSYFYDSAVEQAIEIVMETYDMNYEDAEFLLKSGGYSIYTTMDIDIQAEMEAKYADQSTFTSYELDNPPQASGIIMDYSGNILGIVGGIGTKTESRILNRANDSARPPGSTIKPIASFGPAIMYDLIHWSTIFPDEPVEIYDYSTGLSVLKHRNYSGVWTYNDFFTNEHLRNSYNTAPTQIVHNMLTEEVSFDFLVNNLNFTTLTRELDAYVSPLSVGSFSRGMTLKELTASYQIFGNSGKLYEPTYIKRITDADGKIIYEHQYVYEQAMDSQSAWVMNRLMKEVTTMGTGTSASSGLSVEVVGKTGTSDNEQDILFVGCTPEYVSGIWYGYDEGNVSTVGLYYGSSLVWNNVFRDIVNESSVTTFTPDPSVVMKEYCTETGLLASPYCTSTSFGYYKTSNIPYMCSEEEHRHEDEEDENEDGEDGETDENDDEDGEAQPEIPEQSLDFGDDSSEEETTTAQDTETSEETTATPDIIG